ncbi:SRPBCC domain-containing protein [Actinokineospora guangxiensis]|uniref:SRPBCC domain-containing protein n=1 Tax=Actinokineospora guangxiensis TaxID=1490288 RepID=A0ABW0EUM8_9PSEU
MGRTDRASLLVHADPTRVFAALVEEHALTRWLPPTGMRGRFERFDMREGGSYRLVLTYDDASAAPGKTSAAEDVSEVRIARLIPGERLVAQVDFESDDPAFAGTMELDWSVSGSADGTTVVFEARDVPAGIRAHDHAAGMTSSLANLAAYLGPS